MLTRSFIHLQGVGRQTEQKLWDGGIHTWQDMLSRPHEAPVGVRAQDTLQRGAEASLEALERKNWSFFYRGLPSCEQWRLLHQLPLRAAYLDIETTGLSPERHEITCIGVYDGRKATAYVLGDNLDEFARDIAGYDLIVTYNGKSFDVPFIRHRLGVPLDLPHVDLMYVCRSVGLKGGLKIVEHTAGISRDSTLDGVDGWMAVRLWKQYVRNQDRRALETLVAYNLADTMNLLPLGRVVWNRKLPAHFAALSIAAKHREPKIPWKADKALVDRLLGRA